MFSLRHPIMRPLWRRLALTALSIGWSVMELTLGNFLWAAVFGVIAFYCVIEFFVRFDPQNYKDMP
ncbi:MAG: hypothetical protein MK160_07450 [Rhodobacteraceae bacterium]|nr:hypothetical protein [Paracoccaceae bacterium]